VSLAVSPANVTTAGLAVALLLGGVANGIAPPLWSLNAYNPILWLDAFSYTRSETAAVLEAAEQLLSLKLLSSCCA
jgi:hypothetical protein